MNIRNQRGAVALVTTVIISLLLSLVVSGLLANMVSELRQSSTNISSTRAYYAAQSGVEDAASKIATALASGVFVDQKCTNPPAANTHYLNPNSPYTEGWTCQQITYGGAPEGKLTKADQAVQYNIGSTTIGAQTVTAIDVEWDQKPGATGLYFNAPATFPGSGGWNYAAALELGIVDYPTGGFDATNSAQTKLTNVLIRPQNGGGAASGTYNRAAPLGGVGGGPRIARCTPGATPYHCKYTINMAGMAGRSLSLRLRSRYVGTDYKLTFRSGATTLTVPDGTATVDVTGRSGDTYRRVIYIVPFIKGAAAGLDFVLYSDTDLCKNFDVVAGYATANCGQPPAVTPPPTPVPTPGGVDEAGNAEFATQCATPTPPNWCGAPGPYEGYRRNLQNTSSNNPADVLGCRWDLDDPGAPGGDGIVIDQKCNSGDVLPHEFAHVAGTHNIILTIHLRNGLSPVYRKSITFK